MYGHIVAFVMKFYFLAEVIVGIILGLLSCNNNDVFI